MYRIVLHHIKRIHEYEELIKVFLRPDEYRIENNGTLLDPIKNLISPGQEKQIEDRLIWVPQELSLHFETAAEKNRIKRYLYDQLSYYKDRKPEWGIMTGVRPVKLAMELIETNGEKGTEAILCSEYRLSLEKARLLLHICDVQKRCLPSRKDRGVGLYIGIPFCPTRCLYCSFTSNQVAESEIEVYLKVLLKEIAFVGKRMKETGLYAESIYVGGGTPTTLSAEQLNRLFRTVRQHIDCSSMVEYTVEAGRPDTITGEKIETIKEHGISRISINPQSMKRETLEKIGRSHTSEDILKAFRLAQEMRIPIINADIIAGLPDENVSDFLSTLNQVIELKPENVTVHTMALKRASKLKEMDSDYHYRAAESVRSMLSIGKSLLKTSGYEPYYLYRQKQMMGNFENIGYAKPQTEGIYNIRIMEEKQTIIACGAGAISKRYYPLEDRLERIANVSNYQQYIDRIDEMILRKENKLFHE